MSSICTSHLVKNRIKTDYSHSLTTADIHCLWISQKSIVYKQNRQSTSLGSRILNTATCERSVWLFWKLELRTKKCYFFFLFFDKELPRTHWICYSETSCISSISILRLYVYISIFTYLTISLSLSLKLINISWNN